jgi:hypothetical protein
MVAPQTVHAVVLGDFGRDAGIRFCAALSRAERRHIVAALGPSSAFFDEYRRTTMTLVGDLPFVKEPFLGDRGGRALDQRVLVGFPGGPSTADVAPRLGDLALEALAGPLRRGVRRAVVLLPCNTLAPVSWALEQRFEDPRQLAPFSTEPVQLTFPTVPGAVFDRVERQGALALLPLGTMGIARTYRREAGRRAGDVQVIELGGGDGEVVLEAIGAALQRGARRDAAGRALAELVDRQRQRHGESLVAVEACTDLDYGLALDSNTVYAEEVVGQIYGLQAEPAP